MITRKIAPLSFEDGQQPSLLRIVDVGPRIKIDLPTMSSNEPRSSDVPVLRVGTSGSITVLYFAAAQTETGLFSEDIPLTAFSPHASSPTQRQNAGELNGKDISTAAQAAPRLSDLGTILISRHPSTKLAEVLESSAWSVNEEMVSDDPDEIAPIRLKAGDVVAVIPPVSGG
jgi:molybdopterin converting factor small subunit